ncbi:LOW QUALITY PROTEIN: protein-methionine sulfoxide oxidase mical3b [Oreochromis niloticus]|uniref:LOW QUALITY PROTEIN: protein-methionine sulfoxide oxidase mical3b n=1 Tax=Oreochromis niloticus TaxID=8128 RepID=UPI000DF33C30|nr:LOW QUALITY PROTEIN: protein-methionine sulfoxide oxidase mical3a [Oreochromis niloticus]
MEDQSFPECQAQELFDEFVSASTCRAAMRSFSQLCEHLQLDPSTAERPLYRPIKRRLNYWRANGLWAKLDRRGAQEEYQRARACSDVTCVIIGAGPCGLRTAVELSFMGARVVLLEKRDTFSRNNVLHLWPFTIHDLRGLGAKKFYGRFCAGSIDHISIRQLQLVLLKVALLLGVEVHVNVEFKKLVEPAEDQHRHKLGWRMEVSPKNHPVSQLEFDVIIGADGRRNTLPGFRRKEFRGKLAIAITANFKNRNTTAEAKVEEISGVAFIFNQRFFQELRQETGIDLENIVYYKDDTHYFVMTAKKQSLLEKGVILQDFADTELLLSRGNVDQNALQAYAREAADFSTNHQLPALDFAMNHYGQPDVAMFDFTCMYASENAAMVRQRHGHQLLVTLVGDSLLEPFWPMGTGVARGFLAALDSAWMIRSWAQGAAPLDVLAERESLYRLLPQTTPENMQKNITLYSVDPTTRYMNTSPLTVTPAQVRHLVDTGEEAGLTTDCSDIIRLPSPRYIRQESFSQSNQLLTWCQEQTCGYHGVNVTDLTTSWRSGLALCALIHRYRPDLIDFDSLDKSSVEENTRLGFDVAEREFGISPLMTVEEMSSVEEPDSLSMVMYLSQFYQLLKDSPPPAGCLRHITDLRSALIAPASLLSRLGTSLSRKRNPKEHGEALGKRRKTSQQRREQQESCDLNGDVESQSFEEEFVGGASRSRVRLMANQLQAKLDESSSTCRTSSSPASADFCRQVSSSCSHICFFCKQRVYVMERLSAEGLFFHRSCFQCGSCSSPLRLASYTYDQHAGRFYCLRSECHLSAPAVRKRPTPSDRAASHRTSIGSQSSAPSLSDSLISAGRRPSSAASLLAVTPERIELEIWRRSSEAELQEELEEVSEEVLNLFNLSTDNQTGSRSRSSESDMEEEAEGGGCVTSDETRSSSRETLQLYLRVQEEEEEEGSDMESSDEGEYDPWEMERRSGLWLLLEEETEVELPPHSSDTPVQPDSTSSMNSSVTPPPVATTASTASFITTPDSLTVRTEPEHHSHLPLSWRHLLPVGGAHLTTSRLNCRKIGPSSCKRKGRGQRRTQGHLGGGGGGDGEKLIACPLDSSSPPCSLGAGLSSLRCSERLLPLGRELGGVGARNLLKTVFSGNKNEEKKKGGRTLPAERVKEKTASQRFTDVRAEVSDLDSSTVLQRCSLKPQNNLRLELLDLTNEIQRVAIEEEENQEPPYVPHAVAFKRSYAIKRRPLRDRVPLQDSDGQSSCPTEVVGVLVQPKEASSLSVKETMFQRECEDDDDDLDTRITRRVQRAARRQAKQEELKRLHKAQMIQRQLQQVEEKQRQLEERGVMVEKALRGEADYWGESSQSADMELHLGGLGKLDNPPLMQQWFLLVQQKNALVRYEAELMIFARELELEDRQSRLQQELRERMAVDDHLKDEEQLAEERLILEEMLEVVEQRDSLVSLLEEQRLQERQEDRDLEQLMVSGGLGLTWT